MSVEWIEADWPAPPGIVGGTTTRRGGVSEGRYESLNLGARVPDRPEAVAENRRRFVADCGLPAEPAWHRQVHGTTVADADRLDKRSAVEADAVVSRRAGTVCAVLTADCLPVLLCAEDGGQVAAVHAGWRGLRAGVVEAAVASFDAAPRELLAWLGPAISAPAYEVGHEVRNAFVASDAGAVSAFEENGRGRYQADLYVLATRRLAAAGVSRVYGGGLCTYGDERRFFSYRRDGDCGRMASFVYRRP